MQFWLLLATLFVTSVLSAEEPFTVDRCQLIPLPNHRVSFQVDGIEKTCWHFGDRYPRPFFYPLAGPSGVSLTRMGHPGASNHDHHRSVWFAHKDVDSVDFWSDSIGATIRQKHWYCYVDGDDECVMACCCGWYDEHDQERMQQDIVAAFRTLAGGQYALELQITLRPTSKQPTMRLGKTNFGLLAVRVAKTISAHFGDGVLNDSEGRQGEPEIFAKRARWMDYSGPVAVGKGPDRQPVVEGITYFDHPKNPSYPAYWHVRDDGWMGASFSMHEEFTIAAESPLTLRYLLHAHSGAYDHSAAQTLHTDFTQRAAFTIRKSTKKHRQYEVERKKTK